MEEVEIHNPKVKDLVSALLKLDQERKIIISDPDTSWEIDVIHLSEYKNQYELTGEYGEMNTYTTKDTPDDKG